jgi:hypothetical protein
LLSGHRMGGYGTDRFDRGQKAAGYNCAKRVRRDNFDAAALAAWAAPPPSERANVLDPKRLAPVSGICVLSLRRWKGVLWSVGSGSLSLQRQSRNNRKFPG